MRWAMSNEQECELACCCGAVLHCFELWPCQTRRSREIGPVACGSETDKEARQVWRERRARRWQCGKACTSKSLCCLSAVGASADLPPRRASSAVSCSSAALLSALLILDSSRTGCCRLAACPGLLGNSLVHILVPVCIGRCKALLARAVILGR
jgi:hypothetical protein